MLLVDHTVLSLHLLENTLYLDLDANNADTVTVVRGYVDVFSPKKRLHSLLICFRGDLTTKQPSIRRQLIQRHLVLNPSSASTVHGGKSRYTFEMRLLLGGLPDTIDSKNIKVNYYVTAKAAFAYSTRTSRNCPVRVARFPFNSVMLSGDNVARSIDSRRHHAQFLDYHITVDDDTLSVGSLLPLTLWVAPTIPGVRLLSLCVFLVERRSVCGQREETYAAHVLTRVDPAKQAVPGHVLKESWRGTIEYRLPDDKCLVPSMNVRGLFNVRHSLKVSMALVFPEITSGRTQRSISFETDIEIRDKQIGLLEKRGAFNLPEYEATSQPSTPPPVYEYPPAYSTS